MKLIACMCNQPQRLAAALAPVHAALLASPPVLRWGLGYIQGGDVLLVRTPRPSESPVDLAGPLLEIPTDCAIAIAVTSAAATLGGPDNTPPFRYRRWLGAQTGLVDVAALEAVGPRLLEHVPDYLRRNLRGRTLGELVFHGFLGALQAEANLDEPNLPLAVTQRALATALRQLREALDNAGVTAALGTIALTNGRSMLVAHTDEPVRLRRLFVAGDRGERDDFRGVLLVSGGDGDASDGFEDIPARHAVMISRELKVSLAELPA